MTKIPKGTERRNLVHSLRGVSPQLLGSMHLGSMWRRKLFTLCWTRSRERGGEETQTERKRQWQRMKRLEQTASYSSELTLTLTLLAFLWPWPSSPPSDPDPPRLPVTLTLLTSLWPWPSSPPSDPDPPHLPRTLTLLASLWPWPPTSRLLYLQPWLCSFLTVFLLQVASLPSEGTVVSEHSALAKHFSSRLSPFSIYGYVSDLSPSLTSL